MSRIAVAISGGVDSSTAAYLLKEAGHDVTCIYMKLSDGDSELPALSSAEALGLPFKVLDARKDFDREVKSYFAASYMNGETPNPCVVCNKKIKFGILLDFALSLGNEYLATGHYARSEDGYIKKSLITDKDQSYCLWMLEKDAVDKVVFPIGNLSKPRVREIAEKAMLPAAHQKDSQDICFVPDGDYRGFLKEYLHTELEGGFFTDTKGNPLGRHSGHQCYTVGQRKGLGISSDRPLYVVDKDISTNTVILGDNSELFKKTVYLRDVRVDKRRDGAFDACVKLRFRAKDAYAHVEVNGTDAEIVFSEAQRAPSKGQSAVFYDGDTLIGGGIICGYE